jgi:uncharacterized protein DUF3800
VATPAQPLPTHYHAFVDESGDDGFSPSSTEWLVISAIIVNLPASPRLSDKWDGCKVHVHRRPQDRLHWKKLDHPAKKALLLKLSSIGFTIVTIAAHKRALTKEQELRLSCPSLYFFATKFLTERLSWFARDRNSRIHVTFEDRPQVNFADLKNYIFTVLPRTNANAQISYPHLHGFNSKHHSQERRLEMADCIASSIANGLNVDAYGAVETSYAISLLSRMWERNGNLYSYGLKIIPGIDRSKIRLFAEIDHIRSG